jgi:chromosome segregation ATPase
MGQLAPLRRGVKLETCKAKSAEAAERLAKAEGVLEKKIDDRNQISSQVEEMDMEKAALVADAKERAVEIEDVKRHLIKLSKDKAALLSQVEEVSGDVRLANQELAEQQTALQETRAQIE